MVNYDGRVIPVDRALIGAPRGQVRATGLPVREGKPLFRRPRMRLSASVRIWGEREFSLIWSKGTRLRFGLSGFSGLIGNCQRIRGGSV